MFNRISSIGILLTVLVTFTSQAWGTGACCLGPGDCYDGTSEVGCATLGGEYYDNIQCTQAPCNYGACCIPSGCAYLTESGCATSAGTFVGFEIACEDAVCLAGCCVGYDCYPDVLESWCDDQGGEWGDSVDCDVPDICGVPNGACCLQAEGTCLEDVSESDCADSGGEWFGDGVSCWSADCDPGACCLGDHVCVETLEENCEALGGEYFDDHASCFTSTCSEPYNLRVPGEYATIQAAIDASSDGDVITVAAGTYIEHSITTSGKAITILGALNEDGTPAATIDAQQSGPVFSITSGETDSTLIDGLILTGGTGTADGWGGAIYCVSSSPTISNCDITDNTSEVHGGGIYLRDSEAVIVNCRITGNSAAAYAGGIYCYAAPAGEVNAPRISGCVISGNSAGNGGGTRCYKGAPVFSECIFEGNYSETNGGGASTNESAAVFGACTFTGNTCEGLGGGLYEYGGGILNGCTVSGNSASSGGGGVYLGTGTMSVLNTLGCGNTPDQYSGSYVDDGNNTFADNCPGTLDCCVGYDCYPAVELQWCVEQAGFWSPIVDCNGVACGDAEGACCTGGGDNCLELTEDWCEDLLQGEWMGPGTTCEDFSCYGACCYEDTCDLLTINECEDRGGLFQGRNILCEETECPGSEPGACCFSNYCSDYSELECIMSGGYFQGVGTTCDDAWMCAVTSCCFGETCANYTYEYCLEQGGEPGETGEDCVSFDPCATRGACCPGGYGECYDYTTQDDCDSIGGYWLPWTDCEVAYCSRGNCCIDGKCEQLLYVDCIAVGGDYYSPGFEGCLDPEFSCPQTLVVDWNGTGDYLTIQEAVDAAVDGDTVLVKHGTYTGSGDASIPVVDMKGKAIELVGEPKRAGKVYIDGQNQRPCLVCASGENADTVIDLVECINGLAEKGGALYCLGSPTITNCAFRDSSGTVSGGGVYIEGGSPSMTDCEVTGNSSPFGGGFYLIDSNATMTGGLIGANSASNRGGGLRIYRSSPELTNVTIQGNWAVRGGAAHTQEDSVPVFDGCLISDNMADSLGGGLAASYNSPAVYRGCTFTGNEATGNNGGQGSGGAIYSDSSPVVVENCLIEGNTADTYGGGIYCWYSSPVVTGTTIRDNTATALGAGIRTIGGSGPSLDNDILCGNLPDNIGGSWDDAGDNCIVETCTDVNDNDIPDDCEDFCDGDTNGDGVVDIADILAILDDWGGSDADMTGDGAVNIDDLLVVIGNWGQCA